MKKVRAWNSSTICCTRK